MQISNSTSNLCNKNQVSLSDKNSYGPAFKAKIFYIGEKDLFSKTPPEQLEKQLAEKINSNGLTELFETFKNLMKPVEEIAEKAPANVRDFKVEVGFLGKNNDELLVKLHHPAICDTYAELEGAFFKNEKQAQCAVNRFSNALQYRINTVAK